MKKEKKCPGLESNQHGVLTPLGPQPNASANSATRAFKTGDFTENEGDSKPFLDPKYF